MAVASGLDWSSGAADQHGSKVPYVDKESSSNHTQLQISDQGEWLEESSQVLSPIVLTECENQ